MQRVSTRASTRALQPHSKSRVSEKHNTPVARRTPLRSHRQRTMGRHMVVLGGSEPKDSVSRENPKQMNLGFSHGVLPPQAGAAFQMSCVFLFQLTSYAAFDVLNNHVSRTISNNDCVFGACGRFPESRSARLKLHKIGKFSESKQGAVCVHTHKDHRDSAHQHQVLQSQQAGLCILFES